MNTSANQRLNGIHNRQTTKRKRDKPQKQRSDGPGGGSGNSVNQPEIVDGIDPHSFFSCAMGDQYRRALVGFALLQRPKSDKAGGGHGCRSPASTQPSEGGTALASARWLHFSEVRTRQVPMVREGLSTR